MHEDKRKILIHKDKRKGHKATKADSFAYAALAVLLAFVLVYSLVNVGGPSFYGDDTVYLDVANSVLTHLFRESPFIFSVRLMQIYPIALFYALFGVNMISSSLWDILAFTMTVAVVFFIGKELYNNTAGLVSALLYSFFPLVVRLSATVSDDLVMAFVTALAVMAIVLGEKRDSKKWYFAGGVAALASPLVTPEGAIIIVFLALFLLVELLRKKIKLKSVIFAVYGFLFAAALLMLANYALSGNPLITITVTNHFYSTVGEKNTIPSTNTNLNFYIATMFPYHILEGFVSGLRSGNIANAFTFLEPAFFVPNSRVGFYMYALVIAFAYLLVKREKRAYVPMFWFLFCFAYLEFGPMHVSLVPFQYLLSYRLGRFLTLVAPPTVLIIGIAVARSIEKGSRIKRKLGFAICAIAILFLIVTSISINLFWHGTLVSQRYDQVQIANYLNKLPSSTKIYFSGFASLVPIYMHFDNLSRFLAYDEIENCSKIPSGVYVIIPYFKLFNLNYTKNPTAYCPNWKLVYAPQPEYLPKAFSSLSEELSFPFEAKLYFVPSNSEETSNTTISTSTTSTSTITTILPNETNSITNFNFFNLTGVGFYNSTEKKLSSFTTVNNVSGIYIGVNNTAVAPGNTVLLNVTFVGNFLWGFSNAFATAAVNKYLGEPVINIHYYGVEQSNQSGKLLVQNNGPWYDYVTQIGEPHQVIFLNASKYLRVEWLITPNATFAGNTLKLCGGYFAAYENTTLDGGWAQLYNKLAYEQARVVNSSVINIPSSNCVYLNVTRQ
ncbi:MAG: glycosyltransferase family 39 protein [Candidatus Micrarchaeaceae archaeon]